MRRLVGLCCQTASDDATDETTDEIPHGAPICGNDIPQRGGACADSIEDYAMTALMKSLMIPLMTPHMAPNDTTDDITDEIPHGAPTCSNDIPQRGRVCADSIEDYAMIALMKSLMIPLMTSHSAERGPFRSHFVLSQARADPQVSAMMSPFPGRCGRGATFDAAFALAVAAELAGSLRQLGRSPRHSA